MLGIDFRAARWTWTAALVLLGIWLVYLLRSTLFVFVLAVLFAYLMAPLVDVIDRFLPGHRTRTLALALSYILFIGIVATGAILIGSRVAQQATELSKTLPGTLSAWQQKLPDSIKDQVTEKVNDIVGSLPGVSVKFLGLLSNLIYVVIIPVLAFLCLKDGTAVKRHVLGLFEPGPQRKLLDDVLADMDLVLAHYMRSLVLLALNAFTCYSIFLSVIGMPYGILLGVLAGMLEFIPVVGPLAAALMVLIVGAASQGPIVGIMIFLAAFRMFQDYVLSPHLMGRGVELHPLLVLFGVFAGAELAGVAGTFLSVPVLAFIRVLYQRVYQARIDAQGAKLVA